MKKIQKFESIIEASERGESTNVKVNFTLMRAYMDSMNAGNEQIDFSEAIWDTDIPEIAAEFRANGIETFTISSTFSGLITTLAEFERFGIRMTGLTKVRARYTDRKTRERALIPAIRMCVE